MTFVLTQINPNLSNEERKNLIDTFENLNKRYEISGKKYWIGTYGCYVPITRDSCIDKNGYLSNSQQSGICYQVGISIKTSDGNYHNAIDIPEKIWKEIFCTKYSENIWILNNNPISQTNLNKIKLLNDNNYKTKWYLSIYNYFFNQ